MITNTDPDIAALSTVTEYLSDQLATIRANQWGLATPCDDWDLRALVDHVAGGNWFTLAVLSGATADESLTRARQHFAYGSPTAQQAADSAAEQHVAFQAPDVLDRTWHHVAGDLTGGEILRLRLHDLIVHAWDVNQSLETFAKLPEELALWGLAEIAASQSLAVRHFEIDPSQLDKDNDPALAYLALFNRQPTPNRGRPTMTIEQTHSAEASTWIDATPKVVWKFVANVQNLGRYSPETSRTEWLPGSTRHEIGAGFRGHNENDRHEWHTDCVITEFTEPMAFAFDVAPDEDGGFATRWRYTLAAEGKGTRLTESFQSPVLDESPAKMNPDRRSVLVQMLHTTLERIKNDIETAGVDAQA